MELHQIKYFLAVARERNFTRAAQACNVSQPSLTRGIGKLERELGGLVFERKLRGCEMTALGRLILPRLEQAYDAVAEAIDHARSFEGKSVSSSL
jgi:LysR family hydrogen peroxide-inducible transcriptional activator